MEGGANTPVTKDNRRKYIYLYMRYFLIDSISEQFKAFKSGFTRVCAGKILVRKYENGAKFSWGGVGEG